MFQRPSQRKQLIQRIVVSVLALIAIAVGVVVTILIVLGYRLESGGLEQGALIQLDSEPGGAIVLIDGVSTGSRTATKQTVLAGTHTFTLQRDGYEDWSRTFTVAAGTLTWLDYARLVPQQRTVESLLSYASLVDAQASPNSEIYALHETADNPLFTLVNIRTETPKVTTITLPNDLYGSDSENDTHAFSIVEWDPGSRYLLVKHTYADKIEWLVVDTENVANSTNVTRVLGVSFTNLSFAGTDGDTLYGLTADGIIRKLDLQSETISRALVSNVTEFSTNYGTKVLSYLGTDGDAKVAGVYRDGDDAGHVIRSITTDESLVITMASYHNKDYIAVAQGDEVTVLKGDYPSSSQESTDSLAQLSTITMTGTVGYLGFSSGSDYLTVRADRAMLGYELEHDRVARVTLAEGTGEFEWLDKGHVWDDGNGVLTMRDFDGANVYPIASVAEGFDATLAQSGKYFYSIGKTDDGYSLQRVQMILN